MRMRKLIYLIILLSFSITVWAQDEEGFLKREFIHKGDTLRYRILYPKVYDVSKSYPMVLFLHGAGERGRDNEKQLIHGSKLFLDEKFRREYPAIVIFPQCPEEDFWASVKFTTTAEGKREFTFADRGEPTKSMGLLIEFIKHVQKTEPVNPQRLYVGGLSMGGMGTFELLWRMPKTFVAAFPICGGGNPDMAKKYAKHVNLWIFHGADDAVVPVSLSEQMAEAIKKYGGNPKLTIYPGVNHNSWDNTFAEPELMEWLFNQMK
jgi:predicted peptidase